MEKLIIYFSKRARIGLRLKGAADFNGDSKTDYLL
jgi:hypothetical protein